MRFGDLHREMADAAGRGEYEQPRAARDPRGVNKRLVGGETGEREGCGLDIGERIRGAGEVSRRRRDVLGISRLEAIAGVELDARCSS